MVASNRFGTKNRGLLIRAELPGAKQEDIDTKALGQHAYDPERREEERVGYYGRERR